MFAVVCISAKNSGNVLFTTEDVQYLNNMLGTNCSLDQVAEEGYAVVLDGGKVVAEGAQIDTTVDGLNLNLTSPAGGVGDAPSSIYINGTDFSMDIDGFNVAVYDKLLGEVFEMVAFDVNNEMTLLRK